MGTRRVPASVLVAVLLVRAHGRGSDKPLPVDYLTFTHHNDA